MVYVAATLLIITVLFGSLSLSKNSAFSSWLGKLSLPYVEFSVTENTTIPDVIQNLNRVYQNLKWTYSDYDYILGPYMLVPYPIYAYEAKLDYNVSVRIAFCKGGEASVKKIIYKNIVYKEDAWPQYADTYVFTLKRNGRSVQAWAYKELSLEGSKKYIVTEENQLPIIKSLYLKVRKLHQQ